MNISAEKMMFATLMLMAALAASDPFAVASTASPDLRRLHDAWTSEATTPEQRTEMDARLRAAAVTPHPDWRAVADGYFAWRQAAVEAAEARRMQSWQRIARALGDKIVGPPVCITETRTGAARFGEVLSVSRTTCDK